MTAQEQAVELAQETLHEVGLGCRRKSLDITMSVPRWTQFRRAAAYDGPGIYALIDNKTGRAYVGSSKWVSRRIRQHLYELGRGRHSNLHLQRTWNKRRLFTQIVLQETPDDRSSLIKSEQFWIDNFCNRLFNASLVAGRPHGATLSEAHKANISKGRLGKVNTAESIERWRQATRGKLGHPISSEHKERLRRINSSLTRSLELRARISASLTGRMQSVETRANRSASLQNAYRDNDGLRQRISDNSKRGWETPSVRERRIAGIKQASQSDDARARLSMASKVRWDRHGRIDRTTVCAVCGTTFQRAKAAKKETCSRSCASHFMWRRRRGEAQ